MTTASHLLLISTTPCGPCDAPQSSRVTALRMWLDSWSGIGRVAVGMHRQGFDLQLTEYDERGWGAIFHTTGMEHSPTSATGTAWERTPWRAAQRAAWEALRRATIPSDRSKANPSWGPGRDVPTAFVSQQAYCSRIRR